MVHVHAQCFPDAFRLNHCYRLPVELDPHQQLALWSLAHELEARIEGVPIVLEAVVELHLKCLTQLIPLLFPVADGVEAASYVPSGIDLAEDRFGLHL